MQEKMGWRCTLI